MSREAGQERRARRTLQAAANSREPREGITEVFGASVLMDPVALAALQERATAVLQARLLPEPFIEILLAAVEYVGALPAERQLYRENLGNPTAVGLHVRTRYRTKRRAAGVLFLDGRFDLLAESLEEFDRGDGAARRLLGEALRVGAGAVIGFRYYGSRKYLPTWEAAAFSRSIREGLQGSTVRFLDYVLVTPEREESCGRWEATTSST